jgi:hypothetical protein
MKHCLAVARVLIIELLLMIFLGLLLVNLFLQHVSKVLMNVSEGDNFIIVITKSCCLHIGLHCSSLIILIDLLLMRIIRETSLSSL